MASCLSQCIIRHVDYTTGQYLPGAFDNLYLDLVASRRKRTLMARGRLQQLESFVRDLKV